MLYILCEYQKGLVHKIKACGFNRNSATDLYADSGGHGLFCLSLQNNLSNTCLTCPQGLEYMVTLKASISLQVKKKSEYLSTLFMNQNLSNLFF